MLTTDFFQCDLVSDKDSDTFYIENGSFKMTAAHPVDAATLRGEVKIKYRKVVGIDMLPEMLEELPVDGAAGLMS